jgi:hypothetical protein
MRVWRQDHRLSGVALIKARVRSIAGIYKRRGKLMQKDCEVCGSGESQMHHEVYGLPLLVNWLCRPCHLALHKARAT